MTCKWNSWNCFVTWKFTVYVISTFPKIFRRVFGNPKSRILAANISVWQNEPQLLPCIWHQSPSYSCKSSFTFETQPRACLIKTLWTPRKPRLGAKSCYTVTTSTGASLGRATVLKYFGVWLDGILSSFPNIHPSSPTFELKVKLGQELPHFHLFQPNSPSLNGCSAWTWCHVVFMQRYLQITALCPLVQTPHQL